MNLIRNEKAQDYQMSDTSIILPKTLKELIIFIDYNIDNFIIIDKNFKNILSQFDKFLLKQKIWTQNLSCEEYGIVVKRQEVDLIKYNQQILQNLIENNKKLIEKLKRFNYKLKTVSISSIKNTDYKSTNNSDVVSCNTESLNSQEFSQETINSALSALANFYENYN